MPEITFSKGSGGFLNPEAMVRDFGIQPGMQIADFGCGAGYFTIPMAQIAGPEGEVNAVDILEERLSAVKNRAGIFNVKNIAYILRNLEKENGSTLDSGSQDFVLVVNLLFQVENKQVSVKEAERVLKPKGKLIVIDWREDSRFGPKDGRVNQSDIREMVEAQGLTFEKELMADSYHWGMTFRK